MNFEKHLELKGKHAILSPSNWHWINDDPDQLRQRVYNAQAKERGTKLHEYAAMAIELNQRQPKSKKTLNSYINDAIGFKMTPEQPLKYSKYCFGTADAISCRDNFLRIHDLKTGVTPAHMEQLLLYAGLFCLNYKVAPKNIACELRIYQSDEIIVMNPESSDILRFMDIIVRSNEIVSEILGTEEAIYVPSI